MKKLWLGLLCLILIVGLLPVTMVEAATFNVGDWVKVVSKVHVRTDAGTSNPEIDDPDYNYKGVTLIGMLGTILDGPKDADGYTWWKVNFGPDLYEGWCIEGGLQKTSSPPTPMVRGIDVSHHQETIIWEDVYNVGIRFAYVQAKQGAENVITQIPGGTEGTVVLGGAKTKQNGTTYTWWQVLFDSSEQGWVAHTQIERLDGGGIDALEPGMDVRTIGETNLRGSPEIAEEAAYPEWYEDNMRAIAEMKYTPLAPQSRHFYYGSYFFARPCLNLEGNELENEAREEARSFISEAENYLKSGYMQPMLDLEDATLAHPEWGVHYWDDDGTPVVGTLSTIAAKLDAKHGDGTTKERLSQWVLAWIDEIEEWGSENGLVVKPVVYLHPSWICYFNNTLCEKIKENGIWPANVSQAAVNNRNPYEGNTACGNAVENQWDIWQYVHDGWIEGITGNVDLDYYNGTLENLRSNLLIGSGIDVFMLVDLTGSFSDDLPAFKSQAPDLIDTLKSSYPDVRFGLARFEDYPIYPFGDASSGDKAYERLIDLTPNTDAVLDIIAGLYTRYGMDGPESQLVALYQAATGEGQVIDGYPEASIPAGQQGNFRDGATKLFVLWTDAPFHYPGDPGDIPYPGPSFDETVEAILALDPPMVIGISSGGGGLADLEAMAAATGALAPPGGIDTDADGIVDIPEGEPLVATIGYSGQGIAAAIESLVEAAAVLPIADAGGPYTGEIGETIVFDGSGSFDPDGSIVLYEWDFESDGVFDFSSAEPMAEYAYPAEFSGVVTLRVTDNGSNVGTDTSPVEVLPSPNLAPIADAGPDQMVCGIPPAITAMVTLDGSGSYDPDGDPLTYNWTWDGNTASGVSPTVALPPGTTTITLVVNDGKVDSVPDTVDVTVQIPATIDFDPDVLNLNDKGKYVTAYIELPTGYDVSQIDIPSIRLNGTVPALGKPTEIGDHDNDGIPDLMVKFHRTMVQDALIVGDGVGVTITGEVNGISFEGGDAIRVITPAAPHGGGEWARVSTPTTEGWVMAPDSVMVDYAVAYDGDVAYVIVYSDAAGEFHLLKSIDSAATWENITDALEDMLEDNDYVNYLPRVATDNAAPDFLAVTLDMWNDSDGANEVHVFISNNGGVTFMDTGEVEDGGIYFPDGFYVSDLEVSPEDDGERDIAIGGWDNYGDAALFRCTVTGDAASAWEDATAYDGWDDDSEFDSYLVTDIIFSPSWAADKTILVTTVTEIGMDTYTIHLQSGFWGTSTGWNEWSTLGIEAVPIIEDVNVPIWLADFDARRIAGITLPSDYNSRDTDTRILWVWVNYYDEYEDDYPACVIMRVDDDSADPVGPMGQIEDGELWLTNVSYQGTISEGKAIAGVLGTGTYDAVHGSPDELLAECCYGVQVYRNDGIRNMDICCERWHDACKPPTGQFAMEAFYVGEDKAYAVSLWGFLSPYDEDAWSVSYDDGDFWNQLSLIDTKIDYISDVAVSPDCNKTMLVSVNEESGCGCDSVWLHAQSLPEAPEYSGKWLRTWCGQLEGDIAEGWERGLLRLAPEETTGDNVYLVDYGTSNVYWNNMETLSCWDPIGCTELDYIVDLAAQGADTVYALDYYGDVAMFDEDEWQEAVDSEVEYGWTIAVQDDNILVGGCDGDVSYSDDGGETFTQLENAPVTANYTLVTVAFDSYFDANSTIYAAAAGFEGSSPTTGGIYRWIISESDEWENLSAENYAYTGLAMNIPSDGKPETSPDTGGVLYASYVSGDTTGVARCLTPAKDVCCDGTDWDYLTKGLTFELFKMTPQALKVCGCPTPHIRSRLFAIDSSDYYDMLEGLTGTVWSFED